MKHKIMHYNLNSDPERKDYLAIKNNPMKYRIVEETSEFTREYEYIVLLQYIEEENYSALEPAEVYDVDIINLATSYGREQYEFIFDNYQVDKKSTSFDKKQNCFIAALHFKKQKTPINERVFPSL